MFFKRVLYYKCIDAVGMYPDTVCPNDKTNLDSSPEFHTKTLYDQIFMTSFTISYDTLKDYTEPAFDDDNSDVV